MTLKSIREAIEAFGSPNEIVLFLSIESREKWNKLFKEGDGVDFDQPNISMTDIQKFYTKKYDLHSCDICKYCGHTFYLCVKK